MSWSNTCVYTSVLELIFFFFFLGTGFSFFIANPGQRRINAPACVRVRRILKVPPSVNCHSKNECKEEQDRVIQG